MGKTDRAVKISKRIFDKAVIELDSVPEEEYKDVTLPLQLIRDNLAMWTVEKE